MKLDSQRILQLRNMLNYFWTLMILLLSFFFHVLWLFILDWHKNLVHNSLTIHKIMGHNRGKDSSLLFFVSLNVTMIYDKQKMEVCACFMKSKQSSHVITMYFGNFSTSFFVAMKCCTYYHTIKELKIWWWIKLCLKNVSNHCWRL